jgi:hypothetical protein
LHGTKICGTVTGSIIVWDDVQNNVFVDMSRSFENEDNSFGSVFCRGSRFEIIYDQKNIYSFCKKISD